MTEAGEPAAAPEGTTRAPWGTGALALCVRVLLFPFEALPDAVRAGRFGVAILVVTVCGAASVAAVGLRLDMTPALLRKEAREQPRPQRASTDPAAPKAMTDREFDEAVAKARTVELVKMGAGALARPLVLLLLGLGLYLLGRFVGGKPAVRPSLALAAHAGLPGALKAILAAGSAMRAPRVTPDMIPVLVPPPWGGPDGGPFGRLLASADPFFLWTVGLLAIGFSLAAGIGRVKAALSVGVCAVLMLLLTL